MQRIAARAEVRSRRDSPGQSPGRRLDHESRALLEPRFGFDFSSVRVHSDEAAAAAARGQRAKAYTAGNDVVFGPGRYAPHTTTGRWLLAHELAHVIQQHNPASPDHEAEAEARQAATRVSRGQHTRITKGVARGSLHRFGEPENVPDLTFISTQGTPGFLTEATAYHTSWGLRPIRIASIQSVVDNLAARPARRPVGRMRLVMHSADVGVFSSLFAGEPLESLEGDRLSAWAESDVAGLRHDLGPTFTIPPGTVDQITASIRGTPAGAALLKPFGLDQQGSPTGALNDLVVQAAQRMLVRSGRTKKNAAQVNTVLATMDTLLADARTRVADQGHITAQQAAALQRAVVTAARAVGLHATSPLDELGRTAAHLAPANRAVKGGFRAKLDRARAHFGTDSWIDIRGCRAGDDPGYLQAVASFFGAPAAQPHVSGPNWYQSFPRLGWEPIPNRDAVDRLASNSAVMAALNRWSPITGVRALLAAWKTFYAYQAARQRQLSAGPAPAGRFGPVTPQLRLPPALPPLAGGLRSPPAETATASLLIGRPLRLPDLPAQGLTPDARGRQPATPTPTLTLADPWVSIAEQALARLNEPLAELRFYFDADIVLPVSASETEPLDVRFYVLGPRRSQAIANWLGSQWRTKAPGLAALQAGKWRGDQRRVQALVSSHDPDATVAISPDPDYQAHIVST